jgi:hypothetical protein
MTTDQYDQCTAKIRPMPNPTEIRCELDRHHTRNMRHAGTLRHYAYPGSETVVTWADDDRRTFHGEFEPCATMPGCTLPDDHRGRCAP